VRGWEEMPCGVDCARAGGVIESRLSIS